MTGHGSKVAVAFGVYRYLSVIHADGVQIAFMTQPLAHNCATL